MNVFQQAKDEEELEKIKLQKLLGERGQDDEYTRIEEDIK